MKKDLQSETITKQDFQNALDKIFGEFGAMNEKLRKLEDRMNEYHDDIVGQLETLRDENTIGVYQTRELREITDDHETRITKIEKARN